jgi:hypothetical protein
MWLALFCSVSAPVRLKVELRPMLLLAAHKRIKKTKLLNKITLIPSLLGGLKIIQSHQYSVPFGRI